MSKHRFSPPWSIDEQTESFIVNEANGQGALRPKTRHLNRLMHCIILEAAYPKMKAAWSVLQSHARPRYGQKYRHHALLPREYFCLLGVELDDRSSAMPEGRRFPPPWSIEDIATCFVVKDSTGQKIAYLYYEADPGRRSAGKLLTREEAQRLAVNFAKLPELLMGRVIDAGKS